MSHLMRHLVYCGTRSDELWQPKLAEVPQFESFYTVSVMSNIWRVVIRIVEYLASSYSDDVNILFSGLLDRVNEVLRRKEIDRIKTSRTICKHQRWFPSGEICHSRKLTFWALKNDVTQLWGGGSVIVWHKYIRHDKEHDRVGRGSNIQISVTSFINDPLARLAQVKCNFPVVGYLDL